MGPLQGAWVHCWYNSDDRTGSWLVEHVALRTGTKVERGNGHFEVAGWLDHILFLNADVGVVLWNVLQGYTLNLGACNITEVHVSCVNCRNLFVFLLVFCFALGDHTKAITTPTHSLGPCPHYVFLGQLECRAWKWDLWIRVNNWWSWRFSHNNWCWRGAYKKLMIFVNIEEL